MFTTLISSRQQISPHSRVVVCSRVSVTKESEIKKRAARKPRNLTQKSHFEIPRETASFNYLIQSTMFSKEKFNFRQFLADKNIVKTSGIKRPI